MLTNSQILVETLQKIYKTYNLTSVLMMHTLGIIINLEQKNITNGLTSRNEQRQQFPVSIQTDTYTVLVCENVN